MNTQVLTHPESSASTDPILVYDGDCGFCTRAVQFVLAHDTRRGTVRFAARDGGAGRAVRQRRRATVALLQWHDVCVCARACWCVAALPRTV